jgi:hypothetical protein
MAGGDISVVKKDGWIYFISDKDRMNGSLCNYYKIGKTDYDRPIEVRLKEHQTGNPREVIIVESIRTSFIDTLETYLHHRFATNCIYNEWFKFNNKELKEAIKEAKKINRWMNKYAEDVEKGTKYRDKKSSSRTIKPNKKIKSTHTNYVNNMIKYTKLHLEQEIVLKKIKAINNNRMGIDGIISLTYSDPSLTLDADKLQNERGTLYRRFLETKNVWNKRTFNIIGKPTPAKFQPTLYKKLGAEKTGLGECKQVNQLDMKKPIKRKSKKSIELHLEYLELMEKKAEVRLKSLFFEFVLKAHCGTAKEVIGLCKWDRSIVTKTSFNASKFKKKHPGIAKKYLKKPGSAITRKMVAYRKYPW